MLHRGSKIRVNVNIKQFSVWPSVIRLSALAVAFVRQSAKQFLVGNVSKIMNTKHSSVWDPLESPIFEGVK